MPTREYCSVVQAFYQSPRGDGACLFRCVSYGLEGTEENHEFYRIAAVQEICRLWEPNPLEDHPGYKHILRQAGHNNAGDGDWWPSKDAYSSHMLKQESYAGASELCVLGKLFGFAAVTVVLKKVNGLLCADVYDLRSDDQIGKNNAKLLVFRITGADTLTCHYSLYEGVPNFVAVRLRVERVIPPPKVDKTPEMIPDNSGKSNKSESSSASLHLGITPTVNVCVATGTDFFSMPEGPNSLFQALSIGRYGSILRTEKLRHALATGSISFKKEKKNLFCYETNQYYKCLREYRSAISRNSTSGSVTEARLLTQYLGRAVAIVEVCSEGTEEIAKLHSVYAGEDGNVIVLRFRRNDNCAPHFDLYKDIPSIFKEKIEGQMVLLSQATPVKKDRKRKSKVNSNEESIDVQKTPIRTTPRKSNASIDQPYNICGSGHKAQSAVCDVTGALYMPVSNMINYLSLWRCLAVAIYGDLKKISRIKSDIVNHVVSDWEAYKADARKIDYKVNSFKHANSYLAWMERDTSTPFVAEIRAAALLFGLQIAWIVIHQDRSNPPALQGLYGEKSHKVLLLRVTNTGLMSQKFEMYLSMTPALKSIVHDELTRVREQESQVQTNGKNADSLKTPEKIGSGRGRGGSNRKGKGSSPDFSKTPTSSKTPNGRKTQDTTGSRLPWKRPRLNFDDCDDNSDNINTKTPPKFSKNRDRPAKSPRKRPRQDSTDEEQVDDPGYGDVIYRDAFDIATGNCMDTTDDSPPKSCTASSGESDSCFSSDEDEICVPRVKPWQALPAHSYQQPTFSIRKKELRPYYMAAAVHGDERWDELKFLLLPPFSYCCRYCSAQFRNTELSSASGENRSCCENGQIKLSELAEFQEPRDERIKTLFMGNDPKSKDFRSNILAYNRMFSTVQFVARGLGSTRRGPLSVMTVNGKVTYEPNSFAKDDVVQPGQLYFIDQDINTVASRMSTSTEGVNVDRSIVELLQEYLLQNNTFIQTFKTAREVIAEETVKAAERGEQPPDIVLAINPRPKERSGYRIAMEDIVDYMLDNEYARPCRDFVAAVFIGDYSDFHYDSIYAQRRIGGDEKFAPIAGHEPTVDVQLYPLIHMHGERSWCVPDASGKTCSLRGYYKYRLQVREKDLPYSPLLYSGKLFSQYVLDASVKILYNQLHYYDNNQRTIKAAEYETILNYVRSEAARLGKKVDMGRYKILPKGMKGTKRYAVSRFMDGMALSHKLGTPSWFITMTCNPNWPEIQQQLNGRHWMERPDIVCRVFVDRKRHLMSDIIHNQVFGRVIGYFTSDEFQKSSLPHCHMLFIMNPEDRPHTAEDVDRLVSAQLPRKGKSECDRAYYNLVKEHMVHHGCDRHKESFRMGKAVLPGCFANGKSCRFRFPQKYSDSTNIDGKFVQYKRPNNGRRVKCAHYGVFLTNQNVVPHNRYLLMRHKCHINVEYKMCNLESYKYLCVYLVKNPDKAYVSLTNKNRQNADPNGSYEWDEIEHFKEMMYISPTQAVYTIMGYSLGEISHAVVVLPVHQKGKNIVNYVEGKELSVDLEKYERTKLNQWFRLNRDDPNREDQYYVEVPSTHTWNKSRNVWLPRARDPAIGRIALITPSANTMEMFYLRLLLLNVPGAKGWEDIRTVDGEDQGTNEKACQALGLVNRQNEAFEILAELAILVGAGYLRYQFCMVIKHLCISDASELWETFKDTLADDFAYKFRSEAVSEIHHQLALLRIYQILEELGVTHNANLPPVNKDLIKNTSLEEDFQEGLPDARRYTVAEADAAVQKLNEEQMSVFNAVLEAICSKSDIGKLFLIHGAGGVGKTYVYNTLIMYCLSRGIKIASCAATGIAAVLLILGITAHKLFGIPVDDNEEVRRQIRLKSVCSLIDTGSAQANRLKETGVFIWDEVSMVHAWQVNLVDHFFRKLMKKEHLPFGGKVFLFGGDFRQTLPVVQNGTRLETVKSAFFNSPIWEKVSIFELTRNMRAADDPEYADWLLTVGNGSANLQGTSRVELPWKHRCESVTDLIDHVFGSKQPDAENAVILTPKNDFMQIVNDLVAERLPGKGTTYLSANTFEPDIDPEAEHQTLVTQETLQEYKSANLPPHRLVLKEGCIVMLLCNLHIGGGLVNGTRLIVLKCHKRSIECMILNGPAAGTKTYLFRVKLSRTEKLPGTLIREQIPIRVAYCVTVTKSQGSTYGRVGLFLPEPCFSHGQLYVALSRARKSDNVFIHLRPAKEQGETKPVGKKQKKILFTRNEVYSEVIHAVKSHVSLINQ